MQHPLVVPLVVERDHDADLDTPRVYPLALGTAGDALKDGRPRLVGAGEWCVGGVNGVGGNERCERSEWCE